MALRPPEIKRTLVRDSKLRAYVYKFETIYHDHPGQQLFSFDMLCITNPTESQKQFSFMNDRPRIRNDFSVAYPGDPLEVPAPPEPPAPRTICEDLPLIQKIAKIFRKEKVYNSKVS